MLRPQLVRLELPKHRTDSRVGDLCGQLGHGCIDELTTQ